MSPLQLSGKIHCDLFQQDKPLIPGVSLSIKMVRARNVLTFTALTNAGVPRAIIRKPRLFVRKYEPSAGYMNALSKRLLRAPADPSFPKGADEAGNYCGWLADRGMAKPCGRAATKDDACLFSKLGRIIRQPRHHAILSRPL